MRNLRWIREVGPASEGEIQRLEDTSGRQIPEPYRSFLARHNGGRPESVDFVANGIETSLEYLAGLGDHPGHRTTGIDYLLETFGHEIGPNWFPIGRAGGGLILMDSRGAIAFFDEEDPVNAISALAPSFDALCDLIQPTG